MLSGGADNAARLFDVTTGQSQQVAQHDAPVKVVKWIDAPQGGILATGSWDKTIKVNCIHPSVELLIVYLSMEVLGFADTYPSIDCPASGTVLQHGCAISANGSRDCGASHSNIQPHQPDVCVQSRCIFSYNLIYLSYMSYRLLYRL